MVEKPLKDLALASGIGSVECVINSSLSARPDSARLTASRHPDNCLKCFY